MCMSSCFRLRRCRLRWPWHRRSTRSRSSSERSMTAEGPLAGLLVVDMTRALAGPHATMMLGDLGARVIKIETPVRGDDTRGWGPPFRWPSAEGGHTGTRPSAAEEKDRESTYFLSANRNKESVELDLRDAHDREILEQL